jgi:hypothetical protein
MDWGQSRNHLRSAPRSTKPNPVDVENHRHRDATAGGLYLHPSCFESCGQSLTDESTTSALFLTLTASNSSRGKSLGTLLPAPRLHFVHIHLRSRQFRLRPGDQQHGPRMRSRKSRPRRCVIIGHYHCRCRPAAPAVRHHFADGFRVHGCEAAGPLLDGAFSSSYLRRRWCFCVHFTIEVVAVLCITVCFGTSKLPSLAMERRRGRR